MDYQLDLNRLEKKVYSTIHQDGLLDIFLGIILLQFSIAPLLTDIGFSDFTASAVFIPVWLIALLIFVLVRKFISKPRIGNLKPGQFRKSKLKKGNIILLFILSTGFLIGLLYTDFSDKLNLLFPVTFSVIILLTSFVSAYYFEIHRLYFYGIVIAISPIVGEILWENGLVSHHGFPLVFGFNSIILILIGLFLFFRFLKLYPQVKMEQ